MAYPPDVAVTLVPFAEFTAEAIEVLDPDVVVSAMVSASFDCMDVAFVLTEADFTGAFNVLSVALPAPKVVLTELRSAFPAIEVDLIPAFPKDFAFTELGGCEDADEADDPGTPPDAS